MLIIFLHGALVLGCLVIGLFFLRFWRQSRDHLFVYFAAAFWLLAVHWTVLAFTDAASEDRPFFYLIRLAAFGLIIVGVWVKNRAGRSPMA